MQRTEIVTLLGCVVALAAGSGLAQKARPELAAPAALTRTQQEKLEQVASASLFGQFRSSMSDFLWLKVDKYLHSGVDMRGLTQEEKAGADAVRVGHGGTTPQDGNRAHDDETTVVPSARLDWRGRLGDIERDIKPYSDMSVHQHRDPKDTLPLFRLMTWSNPRFVTGYTTGAVMMARRPESFKEAVAFLEEGRKNNPDSLEIEATFAFLFMKAKHRRLTEALAHAEHALVLAAQKDPSALTEDEKTAWEDAVRWQVLAYRELGRKPEAIRAAQEGLKHFPEDATCIRLLKEEGLYNAS